MKHFLFRLCAAALCACLSGMLFWGCSNRNTAADVQQTPAGTAGAAIIKTASPVPEEDPTPSPTPFSLNPVYAFYSAFADETDALLQDYAARLSALGTADGITFSLLLTEHRTALSEGRITVGRLYGSDAGGYSSTLSAAAPGSGSMKGSPERGYSFTYTYNNGCTLQGTFDGSCMEYTVYEGNAPRLYCRIEKAADKWMSTAADADCQSELTVSLAPEAGEEAVAFAKRDGDYLPPALTVSAEGSEG